MKNETKETDKITIMATVYKVKMVSHFINYTEKQFRQMLEELKDRERQKGNTMQIEVIKDISKRDLYQELRMMGLSHDNCDKVIEWSETL